jgi:hypothetical protein
MGTSTYGLVVVPPRVARVRFQHLVVHNPRSRTFIIRPRDDFLLDLDRDGPEDFCPCLSSRENANVSELDIVNGELDVFDANNNSEVEREK